MYIRKAKLKDLPQIVSEAMELLRHHERLDSYYAPATDALSVYHKFFKRCIHSNNRHLLVAENGGKIVGYALGELNSRPPVFKIRKLGFISDVFVDKNYRRKGIAGKFLIELAKWFKSKRVEYVELTSHPKNRLAVETWAKLGFQTYMEKRRIKLGDLAKINL